MTKEELIREILAYETPLQASQLKSYSQDRLDDYLNHLRTLGRRRSAKEPAKAGSGSSQS